MKGTSREGHEKETSREGIVKGMDFTGMEHHKKGTPREPQGKGT
jgi:hypothetical protein